MRRFKSTSVYSASEDPVDWGSRAMRCQRYTTRTIQCYEKNDSVYERSAVLFNFNVMLKITISCGQEWE